MTELAMRKRAAARAGEIGLFVDVEVFAEDFAAIRMDSEIKAVVTSPRSLRQLKFAWALAGKIADACDWLETKEDAMDWLLVEAKHFKRIYDTRRNIALLRPKPTNFAAMDGVAYTKLLKRIVHVATTIVVPGLDDTALRAEIDAMIGPDLDPAPAAAKPRARKPKPEPEKEVVQPVSETRRLETSPPPAQDPPAAGDQDKPKRPTNPDEYVAACRRWLGTLTDPAGHQEARTYFDSETHLTMRRDLGVGIGLRNSLHREIAAHFDKLEKEAKNGTKD